MDKALFKAALVRSDITQAELAKQIGLGKNSLSLKVNGKVRLYTDEVIKICDVLHITDKAEQAKIFLS